MNQLILKTRQSEPSENLVEIGSIQEGTKLVVKSPSWENFLGLGWLLHEEKF